MSACTCGGRDLCVKCALESLGRDEVPTFVSSADDFVASVDRIRRGETTPRPRQTGHATEAAQAENLAVYLELK